MTDREALLAAIAAAPRDDAPRLVYADWLDEHGDADQAEFVRTQVALAPDDAHRGALSPAEAARLRARERALLARNRDHWVRPLRDLGARGILYEVFTRGFVEDVAIDAAAFAERGAELWRVYPVHRIRLRAIGRLARRVANCPHLARIRRLELGDPPPTPAALKTLLASPHLAELEELRVDGAPLTDEDVRALSRLPALPRLVQISLEGAAMTGSTLPDLVARFDRLRLLGLRNCRQFDGRSFGAVLAACNPDALRVISTDRTPLGLTGLSALAAARQFAALEELWLRSAGLGDEAMAELAGADHLRRVTKLYMSDDPVGPAGAAALANWPGLVGLRELNLDRCPVGDAGVAALAQSAQLRPLEELWLRRCGVGDGAAEAIAGCPRLANLRILQMEGNHFTAVGARALAQSPHLAGLRELNLEASQIGDAGANALAASPHLNALRWLGVGKSGVSRPAGHRLIARFPLLTVFEADGAFLQVENLEALRAGLAAGGSEADVNRAVEGRLVRAVLDEPDDPAARRNYATFLYDTRSPWWVPLKLQEPEESRVWRDALERWQQSFTDGRDRWLAPLLRWAEIGPGLESFDRGLLRNVRFRGPVPNEVAEALARFPPLALLPLEVQRGHMTGEGAFQVLGRRPELARLTRLEFRAVRPADLRHVLASEFLTGLEELAFGPCGLGDDAAELLAGSPALTTLREIDFGAGDGAGEPNRIGPGGLAALGASPHLTGLRSLGLRGNRMVGDAGVEAIVAARFFEGLEVLDLRSAGLTAAGVLALAASSRGRSLRVLRLGGLDTVGSDARDVLAASPYLQGLEELDLAGNNIGEAGSVTGHDRA